jgi:hypothetical protein
MRSSTRLAKEASMESNWDWALLLSAAAYSLLLALSVWALLWLLSKHQPLSEHADEDRLIAERFSDEAALAAFDKSVEAARRQRRDAVMSAWEDMVRAGVAAGDPRAASALLEALNRTKAQWLVDGATAAADEPAAAATDEDLPDQPRASVRPLHRRANWRQPPTRSARPS